MQTTTRLVEIAGRERRKAAEKEQAEQNKKRKQACLERKEKNSSSAAAAPLLSFSYLETQVVPARVDLARPLHGLALDQMDPEAVAEQPVNGFGEGKGERREASLRVSSSEVEVEKKNRKTSERDHWRLFSQIETCSLHAVPLL